MMAFSNILHVTLPHCLFYVPAVLSSPVVLENAYPSCTHPNALQERYELYDGLVRHNPQHFAVRQYQHLWGH